MSSTVALAHREKLLAIYNALLKRYGHRNWWPADSPFEVMVGAVLTQNVSWNGASAAISNLRDAGLLNPVGVGSAPEEGLASMLKPARFMNLKARRIKNLTEWYASEFGADIERMSSTKIDDLRKKLLEIDGIGRETADCILLYACDLPVFVVDAYTHRIFSRLGLIDGKPSYDELQAFFMRNIPKDVGLYKDYHAQIVHLGKDVCRKKPTCGECPVKSIGEDFRCKLSSLRIGR